MECKINNDLGQITISEDVLLKVAGYAALECYGIVAMSSKRAKDGFVEWLGRENLTKGVQINVTDGGIDIDLFIIVEYGISIVEVCNIIKSQVCYKIENMTGAKVRKVNISVEGIRV
ncbi:MAG: Asp23/Gls24 family envelope stress response protein [Clostridiales bacterium]|nr:Asp23/Gls24 family envelope stress response protein [Clostridiales bacterium]MDY5350508.1 Asp23/Gls24 family envelope stress response protein [Candidatus Ventricola sp.]MDY5513163.1 Asp23/Gls24 family envelope stress response protein [Candidatus Ventricola sp.]